MTDPDDDTRAEALMGLARRCDAQVLLPLLDELAKGDVGSLVVEAAAELGDRRLRGALARLRDLDAVEPSLIEEAIDRCSSPAA